MITLLDISHDKLFYCYPLIRIHLHIYYNLDEESSSKTFDIKVHAKSDTSFEFHETERLG